MSQITEQIKPATSQRAEMEKYTMEPSEPKMNPEHRKKDLKQRHPGQTATDIQKQVISTLNPETKKTQRTSSRFPNRSKRCRKHSKGSLYWRTLMMSYLRYGSK